MGTGVDNYGLDGLGDFQDEEEEEDESSEDSEVEDPEEMERLRRKDRKRTRRLRARLAGTPSQSEARLTRSSKIDKTMHLALNEQLEDMTNKVRNLFFQLYLEQFDELKLDDHSDERKLAEENKREEMEKRYPILSVDALSEMSKDSKQLKIDELQRVKKKYLAKVAARSIAAGGVGAFNLWHRYRNGQGNPHLHELFKKDINSGAYDGLVDSQLYKDIRKNAPLDDDSFVMAMRAFRTNSEANARLQRDMDQKAKQEQADSQDRRIKRAQQAMRHKSLHSMRQAALNRRSKTVQPRSSNQDTKDEEEVDKEPVVRRRGRVRSKPPQISSTNVAKRLQDGLQALASGTAINDLAAAGNAVATLTS
jgi:hypothetical protein